MQYAREKAPAFLEIPLRGFSVDSALSGAVALSAVIEMTTNHGWTEGTSRRDATCAATALIVAVALIGNAPASPAAEAEVAAPALAEGAAVEGFLARVEAPKRPGPGRLQRHTVDAAGHVVTLHLTGAELRGDDFPVIGGLAYLETLVLSQTLVADDDLAPLGKLARLKELSLWETGVTGAGVAHLAGLASIQELVLGGTKLTDADLRHLERLETLRHLNLARTDIGDPGLQHLAKLPRLDTLKLAETQITDAGLRLLRGMESLRALTLDQTKVTEAGIAWLAEDPRFEWMATPDRTVAEFARRLENGNFVAAQGMITIGLDPPYRGQFRILGIEPIPQNDRNRERGSQSFRLKMHWTVDEERLDTTFHADLAVERGTIWVYEEGIDDAPQPDRAEPRPE